LSGSGQKRRIDDVRCGGSFSRKQPFQMILNLQFLVGLASWLLRFSLPMPAGTQSV
jgi:hypothetical protein